MSLETTQKTKADMEREALRLMQAAVQAKLCNNPNKHYQLRKQARQLIGEAFKMERNS